MTITVIITVTGSNVINLAFFIFPFHSRYLSFKFPDEKKSMWDIHT